jgi:hypothetical protein
MTEHFTNSPIGISDVVSGCFELGLELTLSIGYQHLMNLELSLVFNLVCSFIST